MKSAKAVHFDLPDAAADDTKVSQSSSAAPSAASSATPPKNTTDHVIASFTPTVPAFAYNSSTNGFTGVVSLQAPLLELDERPPVDIVAVVDRSGSMQSTMDLVHQSLFFFLTQLKAHDRLAIVTYDSSVETPLQLTRMDTAGLDKAKEIIPTIRPRGSTDLAGGLFRGMQILQQRAANDRNPVCSVMLFTDGCANAGMTEPKQIVRHMRNKAFIENWPTSSAASQHNRAPAPASFSSPWVSNAFPPGPYASTTPSSSLPTLHAPATSTAAPSPAASASSMSPSHSCTYAQVAHVPQRAVRSSFQGSSVYDDDESNFGETLAVNCTVNTFGFGTGCNATLLRNIAKQGNGVYYFIEDNDALGVSFVDCLSGVVSSVAQGIQVEIGDGVRSRLEGVDTKFPLTINDETKNTVVHISDMQSEETRDLVVRFALDAFDEVPGAKQPLCNIKVTYVNLITKKTCTINMLPGLARVAPGSITKEMSKPNVTVDTAVNRVRGATALDRALALACKDQLSAARKELQAAIEHIKESVSSQQQDMKNLVKDLRECLNDLRSSRSFQTRGLSSMNCYSESHSKQRSCTMTMNSYGRSHARMAMQASWSSFK